jgi:hypothetical protein
VQAAWAARKPRENGMSATMSPDPVDERREVTDSIQFGIWEWEGGQLHEHETAADDSRSASERGSESGPGSS